MLSTVTPSFCNIIAASPATKRYTGCAGGVTTLGAINVFKRAKLTLKIPASSHARI